MVTPARPAPARPRPLPLLGWTLALLALSTPVSLPLFVLTVVGLPLVGAFGVGIPLLLGTVWLTRGLADLHRLIFARALEVTIPRPYPDWPGDVAWTIRSPADASRVWRRFTTLVRAPTTWRELAWLFVNGTLGFAAYVLVISLFGSALWYVSLPLLWWILEGAAGSGTAEEVLRTDAGFWAIDSQATSFAGILIGLVSLALWWWVTPHLLRGYARLSGALLGPGGSATLAARVAELTESRAETVDTQAAELRRIERDLHDGAQARLVSLGMSLGMAEEVLRTDPDAAARLLAEAREDSGQALAELRELVRGMHPPVLADRGLPGAVQALALAHPLPVRVDDHLPGRPPAPVESAAYFAIAEALTNVTKHAHASSATVRLGHEDGRLLVRVSDDGRGGATATTGGGLHGMVRRLSAFDGTVTVTSPPGGPTAVLMEIPCELSSAKTTPCSATG
jgi:signal transduction histidine kinase